MKEFIFDLQLFAAEVSPINATQHDVVSNVAEVATNQMSDTMKTYYDTELLQNARNEFYFEQFGKKQSLPANHGRSIEWRKWNTLPNASQLTEGVVPTGERLGMTSTNVEIKQYGMYVAVTDLLDLHAIDNVILGATEELGASAGQTKDILIRDVLQCNTVWAFADNVAANGTKTAVKTFATMDKATNRLTPDTVAKMATWLKKNKAPTINGKYVALIHPSVTYDLRSSKEWIEAHKYAATTEIFNGEIGELHGVRFVESLNAAVIARTDLAGSGDAKVGKVYTSYFFGKDAFATVDVSGGAMQMITKTKEQIGGPLNQFSTIGYKMEDATKILYPERMILCFSCSEYSDTDEANYNVPAGTYPVV